LIDNKYRPRPFLREAARERGADPATGAGHNRYFVPKLHDCSDERWFLVERIASS
jgi:hypothetical protein